MITYNNYPVKEAGVPRKNHRLTWSQWKLPHVPRVGSKLGDGEI